jgi:cation/acetate symporter
VAWSLFFIALVYVSAPALAVLVKFEVMNNLVGSSFDALPPWIAQWARVDPSLISVADVNGDRILQWGEIRSAPTSSCWRRRSSVACLT